MKAIFAFSGQGAQAVGMGKDLYENSPEAKKIFDLADEVLGYPLTEIIFNGPQEKLTETPLLPGGDLHDELCCAGSVPGKISGDPAGSGRWF